MAEHRIELVERGDAVAELRRRHAHNPGDLIDLLVGLGQELVERRIEEPDGDRQAVHDPEQLDEIGALDG